MAEVIAIPKLFFKWNERAMSGKLPIGHEIIFMNKLTYDDYWLSYLAGHARRLTRVLHYFGLFFGQLLGLFLSFSFAWWVGLIICPLSYMVAYFSHELVEGNSNKPYATRPFWSLVSFFRMLALELTGRLNIQIARLTPDHFATEHP